MSNFESDNEEKIKLFEKALTFNEKYMFSFVNLAISFAKNEEEKGRDMLK